MQAQDILRVMTDMPYPPIAPEAKNAIYAGYLLQDLAGNRGKMTTIHQYLYQNFILSPREGSPFVEKTIVSNKEVDKQDNNFNSMDFSQISYADTARILMKIAQVEMLHFNMLGRYITALGGNPKYQMVSGGRLVIWNGGTINYAQEFPKIVSYNIILETSTMDNYVLQAERVMDKNLSAMLRRLAEDEKVHLTIFKAMKEYLKGSL